jgi:hypothetical protein
LGRQLEGTFSSAAALILTESQHVAGGLVHQVPQAAAWKHLALLQAGLAVQGLLAAVAAAWVMLAAGAAARVLLLLPLAGSVAFVLLAAEAPEGNIPSAAALILVEAWHFDGWKVHHPPGAAWGLLAAAAGAQVQLPPPLHQ